LARYLQELGFTVLWGLSKAQSKARITKYQCCSFDSLGLHETIIDFLLWASPPKSTLHLPLLPTRQAQELLSMQRGNSSLRLNLLNIGTTTAGYSNT